MERRLPWKTIWKTACRRNDGLTGQDEQERLLSRPISYVISGIIGAFFVFFCITGKALAERGNILWTGTFLFRTLGLSLALGVVVGGVICFLMRRAASAVDAADAGSEMSERKPPFCWLAWLWKNSSGMRTGRVFLWSLVLIFLTWLPGFLAYYPAICAYDMPVQLGQIRDNFYIDHHPIAHTLLIRQALELGELLCGGSESANFGIAIYALLQMWFLAAAFSFGIALLWHHRVRAAGVLVAQLFYMFYPFHWYMSISVTKDTVFGAFFVLQVLALRELLGKSGKKQFWILYFSATTGMILFRNNGKYAFLVLLAVVFLVFCFGKERRPFWGRLFAVSLGAFLTGTVLLTIIYRATDAEQGDKREMLSMPIQQLARTMIYHGGVGVLAEDDATMEEADKALINDFILNEAWRNYRPDFADPVKSNTNTYVVRYRTGEFVRTYVHLFRQYPGDFVNAILAVDAGYLYPGDVSHAWVNAREGQAAGGGYAQTRWDAEIGKAGIFKDSKWPWLYQILEKWANDNAYLKMPVLKYLFVPGVWVWLYLGLAFWWLLRRRFGQCVCLLPVLGYYLTLLLGPTVQLRYIYPIMIVFPFLLLRGTEARPWRLEAQAK